MYFMKFINGVLEDAYKGPKPDVSTGHVVKKKEQVLWFSECDGSCVSLTGPQDTQNADVFVRVFLKEMRIEWAVR